MGTVLQVLGAIGVTVGLGLIWMPLGVIFGGFLTIAFGVALERGRAG